MTEKKYCIIVGPFIHLLPDFRMTLLPASKKKHENAGSPSWLLLRHLLLVNYPPPQLLRHHRHRIPRLPESKSLISDSMDMNMTPQIIFSFFSEIDVRNSPNQKDETSIN
jgi:hypothetical protein